jgi:hypothetical protein
LTISRSRLRKVSLSAGRPKVRVLLTGNTLLPSTRPRSITRQVSHGEEVAR